MTPTGPTLAQEVGSASCGRAPLYGQPTSAPVALARWAGAPSWAEGAPDPPAVAPTEGA